MVAAGMTPAQVLVAGDENVRRDSRTRRAGDGGGRQERGLRRARRQSAGRHHELEKNRRRLSERPAGRSGQDESGVDGELRSANPANRLRQGYGGQEAGSTYADRRHRSPRRTERGRELIRLTAGSHVSWHVRKLVRTQAGPYATWYVRKLVRRQFVRGIRLQPDWYVGSGFSRIGTSDPASAGLLLGYRWSNRGRTAASVVIFDISG